MLYQCRLHSSCVDILDSPLSSLLAMTCFYSNDLKMFCLLYDDLCMIDFRFSFSFLCGWSCVAKFSAASVRYVCVSSFNTILDLLNQLPSSMHLFVCIHRHHQQYHLPSSSPSSKTSTNIAIIIIMNKKRDPLSSSLSPSSPLSSPSSP